MTYSCPGPLETIGRPRAAIPALACDCHAHIVGPTDVYPLTPERSFTPPDAPTPAYLKMLDTLGVARAVIVQPSVYGADNRRTVSAVGEIGQHRARGIAMVSGDVDVAELRRLNAAGIRGIRFITTAGGGPTLDQLPAVARKIADFGWHIEMYVPAKTWPEILPVVESLPVGVAFDHMGGFKADTPASDPSLAKVLELIGSGKCWVKLSGYRNSVAGYPYADVEPLARLFLEAAPDRCVWGTDWPHFTVEGRMPGANELIDLLAAWTHDAALLKKVLTDNPAVLYGF